MSSRKRDPNLNLEALHALVVMFGVSEASRQTGMNLNTVKSIAARRKWKRATPENRLLQHSAKLSDSVAKKKKTNSLKLQPLCTMSPAEAIAASLRRLKERSTVALASYLAAASESLQEAENKLALTSPAKNLGELHGRLYPAQESRPSSVLQVAILTGQRMPRRIGLPTPASFIENTDHEP